MGRDRPVDDPLDLGPDVGGLVVEEGVEGVDDFLDEAVAQVAEQRLSGWRPGLRRQDRRGCHDRHQLAGAGPGEDLLRPFHPSEQRHERVSPELCGDARKWCPEIPEIRVPEIRGCDAASAPRIRKSQ